MFKINVNKIKLEFENGNYLYVLKKNGNNLQIMEINKETKNMFCIKIKDDIKFYEKENNKYYENRCNSSFKEFIIRIKNIIMSPNFFSEVVNIENFDKKIGAVLK